MVLNTMGHTYLVLVLALYWTLANGQTFEDASKVYTDIVSRLPENYVDVRPLLDQSTAVKVIVGFLILSIVEVNEVGQSFSCNGFVNIKWMDENFHWNESEYNHVTFINPRPEDIWRPRLILMNTLGERDLFKDDIAPLTVTSDGTVFWDPGGLFTSSCLLDLTKYPFDVQTCTLKFASMNYDYRKLINSPGNNTRAKMLYTENGQWDLVSVNIENVTSIEDDDAYSHIIITFTLKRRPSYFLFAIVLPVMIISFLNLFVFFIGVDKGEKISASITVLLAQVMFMSTVSEMLPKTSSLQPRLTIYLFLLMANAALIVLLTIITEALHKRFELSVLGASRNGDPRNGAPSVASPGSNPRKVQARGMGASQNMLKGGQDKMTAAQHRLTAAQHSLIAAQDRMIKSPYTVHTPDPSFHDERFPALEARSENRSVEISRDLSVRVNTVSFVVTFCLWSSATCVYGLLVLF